jgi:hypothetical protein
VESLKNSDVYSKVFGLIPTHTLDQEQTININIENFPSLRKLQLQMQKQLMEEKITMEKRIAEYAEKERQNYSQFFRRTNIERTKVFLRAQHVIKYRRPDIAVKQMSETQTPQDVSSDLDENTVFGDQMTDSYTSDYTSMSTKKSEDDLRRIDDDDLFDSDEEAEEAEPLPTVRIITPESSPAKKSTKPVAQSFKELSSGSYFYRMNAKNKQKSAVLFGFDESDVNSNEAESDEESDSESEVSDSDETQEDSEQQKEVIVQPTQTTVAPSIPLTGNLSRIIANSRPSHQSRPIYSSSLPVQIPIRSQQYSELQQQLKLQAMLAKKKEQEALNSATSSNSNNTSNNSDNSSSTSNTSTATTHEEESDDKEQPPNYASLVSGYRRVHQSRSIRRRAEDDEIMEPQHSFIEQYMSFRDDFFTKHRIQQQEQQQQEQQEQS